MEIDYIDLQEFYNELKSKEKQAEEESKLSFEQGDMIAHNFQDGKRFAFRWMAEKFNVEFL